MAGNIVHEEVSALRWNSTDAQFEDFQLQKESIIKKYHFDYPLFYFSLSRKSLPDTLYKIFPLQKRTFIKNVCTSYGDKSNQKNFISKLELFAQNHPQVNAFYLCENEKELGDKIKDLLAHNPELQEIQFGFNQLIQNRGNINNYLPSLHWNGTNCRYHLWLIDFIRLKFGRSVQDGLPLRQKLIPALFTSVKIGLPAIFLLFLISLPIGVYLSVKESPAKKGIIQILYILQAMPLFWIAELLLVFLASKSFLYIFPSFGTGSGNSLNIQNTILPIASLVISAMPIIIVQTKKAFEQQLQQPFILTARSKGLSEQKIIWKHIFRNAITPIITLFFSFLPSAVAGVMIVEFVFSLPGAGRLLVEAISMHDYVLILTIIMIIGIIKLISSLLADIGYYTSDPRVHF